MNWQKNCLMLFANQRVAKVTKKGRGDDASVINEVDVTGFSDIAEAIDATVQPREGWLKISNQKIRIK